MRMWMVDPMLMCDRHLLGEHFEIHMFVGCLNKGKSVKGYLEKGLLEIQSLKKRHGKLVREMKRRGMKHNSKLICYYKQKFGGYIDREVSKKELFTRCVK